MMHCVKSMFVVREAYFCTLLGVFADYIPLQIFQLFYVYFDWNIFISVILSFFNKKRVLDIHVKSWSNVLPGEQVSTNIS